MEYFKLRINFVTFFRNICTIERDITKRNETTNQRNAYMRIRILSMIACIFMVFAFFLPR